jgi:dienelactone hydrolase
MAFSLRRHLSIFFSIAVPLHCGQFARALESPPTREAFLKMIDRPRVEPKAELGEAVEDDGLKTAHFSFYSEEKERVPGIVIYPAAPGGKMPCVIVLHGTGGSKDGEIPLLKKLAGKGFAAIAIDGRFHGERVKDLPGKDHYNQAILARFKGESKSYPLYWDTVWDLMRLIDVINANDNLDSDRIGMIGFSKGGIETYFTAAADPRVAVAVPCIGVQSFKWGLENDGWHGRVNTVKHAFESAAKAAGVEKPDAAFAKTFFDKVLPGVYDKFDGPEMVPLIAPRPLMMINGDKDPNTPLPGVMLCAEKTKAAYTKAGVADKFKQIVEKDTPHKVNDDALNQAIDFLVKSLGL